MHYMFFFSICKYLFIPLYNKPRFSSSWPIYRPFKQNNTIGNWQYCLPGGDQLLLRHPLHLRDVLQDVRPRHRLLLHPAVQPVRLLRGDLLDPGDGAHHVQRDAAPGHVRPSLHPPAQGFQGNLRTAFTMQARSSNIAFPNSQIRLVIFLFIKFSKFKILKSWADFYFLKM